MLPVCPACESEIELDDMDVDAGEIIGCPECGVDLLVLSVAPIELELVISEEGEWGGL
jgi:lysine biosynthesis protein LysW